MSDEGTGHHACNAMRRQGGTLQSCFRLIVIKRLDVSLELAIKQIEFARGYTLSILTEIDEAYWFVMPPGCPTHVAWQVGHLAMAEYGLGLFRQGGRAEIDTELMSGSFRKQFSRGSVPEADASKYPTPAEIRSVLD